MIFWRRRRKQLSSCPPCAGIRRPSGRQMKLKFNLRYRLLTIFCVGLLLVVGGVKVDLAEASPGAENSSNLKSLYVSVPLVFTGIAGKLSLEGTPFKVTRIYKSPWTKEPPDGKIYLNKQPMNAMDSEAPVFQSGKEYLVFAGKPTLDGVTYQARTALGAYNTTVEENLKTLRHEKTAEGAAFIFIGQLKKLHSLKGQRSATPDKILKLDAMEVFNTAAPEKFEKGHRYSIAANFCGEDFEVGKKYLVYANRFIDYRHHSRQIEIPKEFGNIDYYANCQRIYPLHEKDILVNLGKIQKK